MNTKQLNDIKCMLEDSESKILGTKGNEYVVSNEDRLKFFKDYATQLGIDPKIVCSIFLMKHINSILNFAKTNQSYSESIKGRINDARNYLLFMWALVEDEVNEHMSEDAGSTQREFDEDGNVCDTGHCVDIPVVAKCFVEPENNNAYRGGRTAPITMTINKKTTPNSDLFHTFLSSTEDEVRSQDWEENCKWNLNNESETELVGE